LPRLHPVLDDEAGIIPEMGFIVVDEREAEAGGVRDLLAGV
jgi:hypothetical protein